MLRELNIVVELETIQTRVNLLLSSPSMSRLYLASFAGSFLNSSNCSSLSLGAFRTSLTWWDLYHSHLKFVPPGPAYFAPNPVVIHTDDRRKGTSFPTTAVVSLGQKI